MTGAIAAPAPPWNCSPRPVRSYRRLWPRRASGTSPLISPTCAPSGKEGQFDVCACNPPYFTAGPQSTDAGRAVARHETDCTLEDVCACGFRLLKDGGKLSLCHRPERLAEVLAVLRAHRLEPKRLAFVKNKPDAAPWLFLVEAQKTAAPACASNRMCSSPPGRRCTEK